MILSFYLVASAFLSPLETDILFIPHYPGETNEFLPVFDKLQKEGKKFHILPLGTAKKLIDANRFSKELIICEEDADIPSLVKAKIVITGVHSEKQASLLEAYTKLGAKTFAYWDNPEPRGAAPYFQTALKVQRSALFLLTPSNYVASAPEFKEREKGTIKVVGKPTLQNWQKEIKAIDTSGVLAKTPFDQETPIVTFVGTYGEAYEKAFLLLIDSLNESSIKQVIFQIHPAASGDFEIEACKKLNNSIRFILAGSKAPVSLSMAESISISDKVMTYNSSAGFQAFFAGKDVGFVIPENDAYTNSLIETKLAAKIQRQNDLSHFFNRKASCDPDILYKEMGFPENSPDRFVQVIEDSLG